MAGSYIQKCYSNITTSLSWTAVASGTTAKHESDNTKDDNLDGYHRWYRKRSITCTNEYLVCCCNDLTARNSNINQKTIIMTILFLIENL